MEMIDRVAEAIGKVFSEHSARLVEAAMSNTPDVYDKVMADVARAAIEAMRDPTEDMREVGGWSGGENGVGRSSAAVVWSAMIDAALATP